MLNKTTLTPLYQGWTPSLTFLKKSVFRYDKQNLCSYKHVVNYYKVVVMVLL